MLRYAAYRIGLSIITLFGLATITFFALHLIPGNPVRLALGIRASPHAVAQFTRELGLNRPLMAQYGSFLSDLLHGNLGTSISLDVPVRQALDGRLTPSVILIGYGLFIAIIIGVPLAIASALRPNGVIDHVVRLITTFSFGMPAFWLGLMAALVFGFHLRWLPVSGYGTGFVGVLRSLTLPALTLGLSLVVIVTRTLRSNLIDVLKSEYVEAARSRGLSEVRIIAKHAMRNAIMPTFTILSVTIGFLIGGTVVIEQVFQIPGVGSLLINSIEQHDYDLVQAITLLAGTAVVAASLVADMVQAVIDPRVRLGGQT